MAKYPGLVRRGKGGIFHFRRRVPEHLRAALGKREIVVSLDTTNADEAIARWASEDAKARKLFACAKALGTAHKPPERLIHARSGDTFATIPEACNYFYRLSLLMEQEMRFATTRQALADPDAFWAGDLIRLPDKRGGLIETLARAYDERLQRMRENMRAGLVVFDLGLILFFALKVFDEDACADPELLAGLSRAFIKFVDDTHAEDGEYLLSVDPCAEPTANPPPVEGEGPLLSVVVAQWLAEPRSWSDERRETCEGVMRDFRALVGDKPIDVYDKADARAFKSALLALPSNWMKRKVLRGLTFAKAAEKAQKLGLTPQDSKTVNKKLAIAKQAFAYVLATHDERTSNPFDGLAVSVNRSANEAVDPFTLDDLKAIFHAPVFVGARSELHWQEPGGIVLRQSEKFWLPLLGLWTGARLNELCQLTTKHVRKYDGAHYFALTNELRLKGGPKGPSVRNVPVHQWLIEAGFLDYVAGCKAGERLFPSIPQSPTTERYSDAPSKQFFRLLKSIGIKRPRISFQSFRHTFIGARDVCGLEFTAAERIVGHVLPGQASRYGKNYVAEQQDLDLMLVRNREMQKIKFSGLDLSHLLAWQCPR